MYKITNIMDKLGNTKLEPFEDCLKLHPNMEGEFIFFDMMCQSVRIGNNVCCRFKWNDDSDKTMVTSYVKQVEKTDDEVCIVTENSIYTFKKVEG